jgi:hypothetical protein
MPTSALQAAILTWMEQHLEAAIVAALNGGTSADAPTGINAIQAKVTQVMSSIADVQAMVAAEASAEEKLISFAQSQAATNATLRQQLATAAAGSDMAGINVVMAGLQANIDHLNAVQTALESVASAAGSTATTPTDTTQQTSGAVVPPGQPVIS